MRIFVMVADGARKAETQKDKTMKVIILGAGQVGSSLAETLVHEGHDITMIDINPKRLQELQDRLDLQVVTGRCSYPAILRQAGADVADMIIAVTDSDEANMVSCQVAYSLFDIPKKIARIRSPHYFIRKELFGQDNLPIDVFISPEQLVRDYVQQLIMYPGALQVVDFVGGRLKMVVVKPYYGGTLLGQTIGQLRVLLPDVRAKIVAIYRNDRAIQINNDVRIEIGDEVFFVAASEDIHAVTQVLRRVTDSYKRVMIAGGGHIGGALAESLQEGYQVKLIDHDLANCEMLADHLSHVTVFHGDACDEDLLLSENIERTDVFCAVTNDDETNILSCIQAKRLGAKQVMALITRTAYVDLIEGGPINIAISPQQATVGSILEHMRQGDVVQVHSLRRGAAEAIEAVAHGDHKTSRVVGRAVQQVKMPKGAIIGAIVRGTEIIFPEDDTEIKAEDHVILFISDKKHVRDVERLFQVSAGFF